MAYQLHSKVTSCLDNFRAQLPERHAKELGVERLRKRAFADRQQLLAQKKAVAAEKQAGT